MGSLDMIRTGMRLLVVAAAGVLLVACGGGEQSSNPPPANRAPTISIAPSSNVLVGRELTVTPTASDPDGDPLTFSVSNRPAWMSFSAQTGVLTGTPGAGDVGVYNATITVSDGKAQASGQAGITVSAAVAGRATLSWEAPAQRTDGSPLTNLAGFKLYYGTSAGDLRYVIQVADPGARSRVVEDLTEGSWYFAATAYDQSGAESARSNVASKTIA